MGVQFATPVALYGEDRRSLWFEGNSKITAGNGSFDCPAPSSFSLIHVADCPGSTPTCRASCYVHGLEEKEPAVHALYRENSRTMREILELPYLAVREWATRMAGFITRAAPEGFRWHVSGDIFSMSYARFIADVVRDSPDVRHWIYTRSFDLIGPLTRLDNLALNLSCDRDNLGSARFARAGARLASGRAPRLCYLVDDSGAVPSLPEGSVLFPDYALRGRDLKRPTDAPWWGTLGKNERNMVCPVDFFGASESLRCGTCKKCF
jgi:hypothetical protein